MVIIYGLLSNYSLQDVDLTLGEGRSAAAKRVDIKLGRRGEDWVVIAYSLAEGPPEVESVDQLAFKLKKQGLATTVHVASIIPQVAGAPALPLVVGGNSNSFINYCSETYGFLCLLPNFHL